MFSINIYEAKTQLSRLIERVESGEEIIIARAGRPVARLVAFERIPGGCRLGLRKGEAQIAENFDDPLPKEFTRVFEGQDD